MPYIELQSDYKTCFNIFNFLVRSCPSVNISNLGGITDIRSGMYDRPSVSSTYFYGDTIEIRCQSGYRFNNTDTDVLPISCTASGEWNSTINHCI